MLARLNALEPAVEALEGGGDRGGLVFGRAGPAQALVKIGGGGRHVRFPR